MKAKWYKNLRTILKNSEKDPDILRHGNFWHVRGMRVKTQVSMRIQEGLGPSNPRFTCMLDIEWKAAKKLIETISPRWIEKSINSEKIITL